MKNIHLTDAEEARWHGLIHEIFLEEAEDPLKLTLMEMFASREETAGSLLERIKTGVITPNIPN